jgi:hypothetical protein
MCIHTCPSVDRIRALQMRIKATGWCATSSDVHIYSAVVILLGAVHLQVLRWLVALERAEHQPQRVVLWAPFDHLHDMFEDIGDNDLKTSDVMHTGGVCVDSTECGSSRCLSPDHTQYRPMAPPLSVRHLQDKHHMHASYACLVAVRVPSAGGESSTHPL